ERPDRDRVVAAEHKWLQPLLDRASDQVRHPLACLLDGRQEANALAAHLRRLGNRPFDVAPIEDRSAETLDPRREASVPDRGGAHVDPAAASAEIEARPDQGNRPSVGLHVHAAETTFVQCRQQSVRGFGYCSQTTTWSSSTLYAS